MQEVTLEYRRGCLGMPAAKPQLEQLGEYCSLRDRECAYLGMR